MTTDQMGLARADEAIALETSRAEPTGKGSQMNVCEMLRGLNGEFGDNVALWWHDEYWTYASLEATARRFAGVLIERGIESEDCVALLSRNRPEWLAAAAGILGAGGVVVPINPDLSPHEVSFILQNCRPRLVVGDHEALQRLDLVLTVPVISFDNEESVATSWRAALSEAEPLTWIPRDDHDSAVIFYTSGTTGRPKGATLSHRNAAFIADLVSEQFQMTDQDRSLMPGSLAFIYYFLINSFGILASGGSIYLSDRFHPVDSLEAMERYRITIFMGVPTMYIMMLNAQGKMPGVSDLSEHLRLCLCGGAPLPSSVAEEFKQIFGVAPLEVWGLTEATPITSYDPRVDTSGRPQSCGRALPGTAIKIVNLEGREVPAGEVGEVLAMSPARMKAYFQNPEATAEVLTGDGWLRSGDLGRVDADGYLYIVGRQKDLIIRGGANIYPPDIEGVIHDLPGVLECAVVGVPDAVFGERVKAFVVAKEELVLTDEKVRDHCAAFLAEYKVPAEVQFVNALPKGPTGKILRRVLRDQTVSPAEAPVR